MKISQIRQVSLPVTDLQRAITFYRDVLGASFTASFDPPGLAFFDFAGVRLMLSAGEAGSVVYFAVDDIDTAVAEMSIRGVTFDDSPHMIFRDDQGQFGPAGTEEWMVFFTDTEGNALSLTERRAISPAGAHEDSASSSEV
jgi:methylmalonyl-CoA/ethylmalonyl-CoA epimerase